MLKTTQDWTHHYITTTRNSKQAPTQSKSFYISHEWIYNVEAMNAFNAMKVALCAQPLLSFPKFDRPCLILVDASGGQQGGYGACLAQLDDQGQEQPLAYASCALNKAQKEYPITRGKCSDDVGTEEMAPIHTKQQLSDNRGE